MSQTFNTSSKRTVHPPVIASPSVPISIRTIRSKVTEMHWDKLTTALTGGIEGLSLDDGSHKVILVAPRPEDAALPRVRIMTKSVN